MLVDILCHLIAFHQHWKQFNSLVLSKGNKSNLPSIKLSRVFKDNQKLNCKQDAAPCKYTTCQAVSPYVQALR